MGSQEVETVDNWHRLLNSGDIERMMALVRPDVEVGGPRGVGRGSQHVREWFGRAGVQLTPVRHSHRGSVVVAEEEGTWRTPDGGPMADTQTVWSVFEVHDGLITRIMRFDSIAKALEEAGLDRSDEVRG
jgi:hypothetical protein